MSSRQILSQKQRNDRYIPNYAIAQHILDETQAITSSEQVIEIGSFYPEYWVASKFQGRYYHVICDELGNWTCSSSDDRVAAAKIALAQAFRIRNAA